MDWQPPLLGICKSSWPFVSFGKLPSAVFQLSISSWTAITKNLWKDTHFNEMKARYSWIFQDVCEEKLRPSDPEVVYTSMHVLTSKMHRTPRRSSFTAATGVMRCYHSKLRRRKRREISRSGTRLKQFPLEFMNILRNLEGEFAPA